ncbi:MAG: hypothetical protein RMH84_05250 [Sulfolobales archaeon]|nr:hypothetical protein [Sulfolobales archaeon]MDW8010981.1 hypothetical protein [Sulfolobales archaeon]
MKPYLALLLLSTTIGAISTYLHLPYNPPPLGNFGLMYTDIVFGVFYPRFASTHESQLKLWYSADKLGPLLEGKPVCPAPYVDYMFEYPPLIGLLWYFTTCSSISAVLGDSGIGPATQSALRRIAELHYLLNALLLTMSLLASTYFMYRLGVAVDRELGIARTAMWLILPSTVLYAIYNWDVICVALALGALIAFRRGRYFTSGALLGLSIATKLLTVSIAYTLFISLLAMKFKKDVKLRVLISFLAGLVLFGSVPYLALLLLSPRGFLDFLVHHSTWYCENCLYLVVVHDIGDQLHRFLAMTSISTLAIALAFVTIAKSCANGVLIYRLSAISILGVVSLNYVFTPQMVLLFSPLVLIFFSKVSRVIYAVADAMNFSIMFFFFSDAELRYYFRKMGLPVEVTFSPWTIDSPIQWFAAVRNFLLIVILLTELLAILRSR